MWLPRVAGLFVCSVACAFSQSSPKLLKDINRWQDSSSRQVQGITALGSRVVFSAWSESHGQELWISDGTAKGTRMIKDIRPGRASSSPSKLHAVGSKVYFSADDGSNGVELWCTDGTETGTYLVKDFISYFDGRPVPLASSSSKLWLTAFGPGFGWSRDVPSLWVTDGTEGGTLELNPLIRPESGMIPYRAFHGVAHPAVLGESLLFVVNRREIWKSDGTAAGTIPLVELSTQSNSGITSLFVDGGRWYAGFRDGLGNGSFWRGDGQPGIAEFLEPPAVPSGWTHASGFTPFRGGLAFSLWDGSSPAWLCFRDPVSGGISRIPVEADPPQNIKVSGNLLFFTTGEGDAEMKLWRSDGTSTGTYPLKGFRQGYFGANLHDLTPVPNGIYFQANDGLLGAELWFSDGSVAGTRMVADLEPGPDSSFPGYLASAGGRLFFSSFNASPFGSLWLTDGSPKGTRPLMKEQKLNGSSIPFGSYQRSAAGSGKRVFFRANDGRHGEELWVTNGSRPGTKLVRDIMPGEKSSDPLTVTPFGKGALFRARNKDHGWDVWFSDGTRKGTRPLTGNGGLEGLTDAFTVIGKTAYFEFGEAGEGGLLWQTDGSPGGTFPVTGAGGLLLGPYHRSPMARVGETLFLGADDGIHGAELWALDQGIPRLVRDLRPGSSGSSLSLFTAVGRRLAFFVGTTSSRGFELWTSDGTAAGTMKVAEGFEEVSASTGFGNIHLFLADDRQHGNEWWRSDGTPEGTYLLKDISEGSGQRSLDYTTAMHAVGDDAMYFVADAAEYGEELWKTDGTPAGTVIVADLKSGSGSSAPAELLYFDRRIFFAADDGVHGRNIWSTDGTAEGCLMHAPRSGTDSDPLMLVPLGDRLFFAARSPGTGTEPHVLKPLRKKGRR